MNNTNKNPPSYESGFLFGSPNGTRTDAEHPWKNFILPPGPHCIGKGFAVANQICGANLTAEGRYIASAEMLEKPLQDTLVLS